MILTEEFYSVFSVFLHLFPIYTNFSLFVKYLTKKEKNVIKMLAKNTYCYIIVSRREKKM